MSLLEIYENNKQDKNYHLGSLFIDCMKRRNPDGICSIDAATGEKETYASVLRRSIALARCFRRLGLKPGDVLVYGGPLHIDIHIPFYAALLNGLPIVGVDPFFKYDEIKALFKLTEPKIAFCQHEKLDVYSRAAKDLGIDVKIVTFDDGECTMSKFMDIYGDNESTDEFQPADFDTDKIYAWLACTSGTTGLPKVAAFKHRVLIEKFVKFSRMFLQPLEDKVELVCNFSPVQWISSYFNAIYCPLVNQCKLQSSRSDDVDHLVDAINKYKPTCILTSPSTVSSILKTGKDCDFTCFDIVIVTGAKTTKELMMELRSRMGPHGFVVEGYGQTEMGGAMLIPNRNAPPGSCGVAAPSNPVKLVDPDTGAVITEPYTAGELWVKGATFTEYYKNPEETAKAFEDGWYKTGDLMHRDEENNYYFEDRIKLLIKYRSYHVTPQELEDLILTLEGVEDVCVTSIPDPEDGQRPVACVVRRPGCDVTAQQIKDIVADNLSVHKQLRGGVVFLDNMPLTSTGKVARSTLQKIILQAQRE